MLNDAKAVMKAYIKMQESEKQWIDLKDTIKGNFFV